MPIVNAKSSERLLILGDSLSAGYGMAEKDGWVSLLANKLETLTLSNSALKTNKTQQNQTPKILVKNASISGETTSGGKSRLPRLLTEISPKWVVIELGANDALRGQNLKTTQRNLQNMIDMAHQANAKVILLGVRLPTNYGPAYDSMFQRVYRQLAAKNNVQLDPFFIEDVALEETLMQADGLHPNEKAQPIILQRLWPLLTSFLGLSA